VVRRILTVLAAAAVAAAAAPLPLTIYFIDVEGGQATLVVTPNRQSMLIDTGYAGLGDRDPQRIMAAARDAGISRLDVLLITHFHGDHDGGAPSIAKSLPISTFVDYGTPVQTGDSVTQPFQAYAEVRRSGKHVVAKAGERLPLTGVDVRIVSAAGTTLSRPLDGAGRPNPACSGLTRMEDDATENARSTGVLLTLGQFRFLDLGDLAGNTLAQLACPNDLIGRVDVYLVPHHGNADANVPAVTAALRPRVAIVNNGVTKGAAPEMLAALHGLRGVDVWQLHRSANDGAGNSPDAVIANVDDGKTAYWIKLTATADGAFTVNNGRTGVSRRYAPR